jgi:hypothetical protein
MQKLAETHSPHAKELRVGLNNLSTHTPAAFYQTFAPEVARQLTKQISFHYTPKHGSWLNMAECELPVLTRQCLHLRLPTRERVQYKSYVTIVSSIFLEEGIMELLQEQSTSLLAFETVREWRLWVTEVERRIGPRFPRRDLRHRAWAYLRGLLSTVERTNS